MKRSLLHKKKNPTKKTNHQLEKIHHSGSITQCYTLQAFSKGFHFLIIVCVLAFIKKNLMCIILPYDMVGDMKSNVLSTERTNYAIPLNKEHGQFCSLVSQPRIGRGIIGIWTHDPGRQSKHFPLAPLTSHPDSNLCDCR